MKERINLNLFSTNFSNFKNKSGGECHLSSWRQAALGRCFVQTVEADALEAELVSVVMGIPLPKGGRVETRQHSLKHPLKKFYFLLERLDNLSWWVVQDWA